MTHVMLDLETFGTGPTAAIVQIGATVFDLDPTPGVAPSGFERTVSLQSSILAGATIDQDTVAWWKRQSPVARNSIQSAAEPLASALDAFSRWLIPGAVMWSHGAAFDVPILEYAYRSFGYAVPWRYNLVRDTRTLFHLAAGLAQWVRPNRPTAHTALADAVAQAEDVISAYVTCRSLLRRGAD